MAIEHYGRDLCIANTSCEELLLSGINTILDKIEKNWDIERDRTDNVIENGVHFYIKQDKPTPKLYVMLIVDNLRRLEQEYGIKEITHAGLLNFGTLAADFALTFPWD